MTRSLIFPVETEQPSLTARLCRAEPRAASPEDMSRLIRPLFKLTIGHDFEFTTNSEGDRVGILIVGVEWVKQSHFSSCEIQIFPN